MMKLSDDDWVDCPVCKGTGDDRWLEEDGQFDASTRDVCGECVQGKRNVGALRYQGYDI